MPILQKGVIVNSLSLIAPIAHRIRRTPFRSQFDRVTIGIVRGYQKYLSPHKGFSCAYRKLHGGASCSEYFRQTIDRYGFSHASFLFQQRLEACKMANFTLRSSVLEDENNRRRKNCNSSCNRSNCPNYCECGDCGIADCSDYGACDSNSNGYLDCGDCNTPDCGDCAISDCGSLDCGSLDCGGCDCSF
ncbi:MAG: membrane protein insertion efficiency factor YidD [Geitlerinemataceae cyanobacterium]